MHMQDLRDHFGRHGLPLGAADRRRLYGRRAAEPAQTHLHQRSALRCRSRNHILSAFSDNVELFRVDEPDAGDGHAVDDYGFPEPARPQPLGGADSGDGHDLRMLVLCLRLSAHVRHARPCGGLPAGRGGDTRIVDNSNF